MDLRGGGEGLRPGGQGVPAAGPRRDGRLARSSSSRNIRAVLPAGVEAVTGDSATQEAQDDLQQGISQFNIVLSGFAGISLVAGAFLIYNIFGIVVAQRTRELAMLRALGASRGQIRRSVLIEAFITGAVGSIVGLLGGIGLAFMLIAGARRRSASTCRRPCPSSRRARSSCRWSVGLVVTMVSAFLPSWRASRCCPWPPSARSRSRPASARPSAGSSAGIFLVAGRASAVGIGRRAATTASSILLGIISLVHRRGGRRPADRRVRSPRAIGFPAAEGRRPHRADGPRQRHRATPGAPRRPRPRSCSR